LGHFAIAAAAVLALISGSTLMHGVAYWLFSGAVIVSAIALTLVLYIRRSRRWLTETYDLFGEGKLSEVRRRVEAERGRPSSIQREVLELMLAELTFWSGDFEGSLTAAKMLSVEKLPEIWRGAVHELTLVSSLFSGRVADARALLTAHEAALRERPAFHELEALIALKEGDPQRARERWDARDPGDGPRPPMVRAALAMLQAEIALAHGEAAERFVSDAVSLAGESFVAGRARSLTSRRTG
jgi:hypothetical protein